MADENEREEKSANPTHMLESSRLNHFSTLSTHWIVNKSDAIPAINSLNLATLSQWWSFFGQDWMWRESAMAGACWGEIVTFTVHGDLYSAFFGEISSFCSHSAVSSNHNATLIFWLFPTIVFLTLDVSLSRIRTLELLKRGEKSST